MSPEVEKELRRQRQELVDEWNSTKTDNDPGRWFINDKGEIDYGIPLADCGQIFEDVSGANIGVIVPEEPAIKRSNGWEPDIITPEEAANLPDDWWKLK